MNACARRARRAVSSAVRAHILASLLIFLIKASQSARARVLFMRTITVFKRSSELFSPLLFFLFNLLHLFAAPCLRVYNIYTGFQQSAEYSIAYALFLLKSFEQRISAPSRIDILAVIRMLPKWKIDSSGPPAFTTAKLQFRKSDPLLTEFSGYVIK